MGCRRLPSTYHGPTGKHPQRLRIQGHQQSFRVLRRPGTQALQQTDQEPRSGRTDVSQGHRTRPEEVETTFHTTFECLQREKPRSEVVAECGCCSGRILKGPETETRDPAWYISRPTYFRFHDSMLSNVEWSNLGPAIRLLWASLIKTTDLRLAHSSSKKACRPRNLFDTSSLRAHAQELSLWAVWQTIFTEVGLKVAQRPQASPVFKARTVFSTGASKSPFWRSRNRLPELCQDVSTERIAFALRLGQGRGSPLFRSSTAK